MAAVTLHESHQYNSNDRINVATLKILNFILKQDKRKVQTIFVIVQNMFSQTLYELAFLHIRYN